MLDMKNLRTKIENWMIAVAFAEAGEHETALEFVKAKNQKYKKKRIDKKIQKRMENRPRLEC